MFSLTFTLKWVYNCIFAMVILWRKSAQCYGGDRINLFYKGSGFQKLLFSLQCMSIHIMYVCVYR